MSESFRVNCFPVAQPRQRIRSFVANGKACAQNYTPTKSPVNVFKAALQSEAAKHFTRPLNCPVCIHLHFILPRPQSMTRKRGDNPRVRHTKKPDLENIIKAALDALTGIAFVDDSRVCSMIASKWIAAADETPHVDVHIFETSDLPIGA